MQLSRLSDLWSCMSLATLHACTGFMQDATNEKKKEGGRRNHHNNDSTIIINNNKKTPQQVPPSSNTALQMQPTPLSGKNGQKKK